MVCQPHLGMHSIGGIILHAAVEIFWFEEFVLDLPWDHDEAKIVEVQETDVDAWQ